MTRDGIIQRLAGLTPGLRGFGGTSDPLEAAAFRRELQSDRELNPGMASPPSTELRPAAVLVPLIEHADGMSVLLTQRTPHLTAHAGQISFPGGRIEQDDPDEVAAALRETEEEVGLPRDRVSVVGRLDTYLTGTGFEITPIVGIIAPPYPLSIDPFEVAEAFEVPLAFLMDVQNHALHSRDWKGVTRRYYAIPFGQRYIWGVTAGILRNLYERIYES